jgi:RNA polymerase subunit RPABC4/transcription elongation factor Spt4
MTAKTCKAVMENGQRCPNLTEGDQDLCPYHLAGQAQKRTGLASIVLGVISTVGIVITVVSQSARKR